MEISLIIMIAVSLSMDAFSLSLAYGTLNPRKKDIYILSIIVGLYHFFMPLIGHGLGHIILRFMPISPNAIVFIVLLFIGGEMIYETFKKDESLNLMCFFEFLLFGLAVSIDSFSVGIGLDSINHNTFFCSLCFSICSFIFTFLGLKLGKKLNEVVGKTSTLIGGIILIIIGFVCLF